MSLRTEKVKAIEVTMAKYPKMNKQTAIIYVEEVLGYPGYVELGFRD